MGGVGGISMTDTNITTELSQDELMVREMVKALERLDATPCTRMLAPVDPYGDELAEILMTDLVPGPSPRLVEDRISLNKLIADVQTNGMKQLIVVRRSPHLKDKYEVLDGRRRCLAAKSLQWLTVKAVIAYQLQTDEEAYKFALMADNKRKELSEYELGRWLYILLVKFPSRYPNEGTLAKHVGLRKLKVSWLINLYTTNSPGLQKNQVKKVGRPTTKARRHHS